MRAVAAGALRWGWGIAKACLPITCLCLGFGKRVRAADGNNHNHIIPIMLQCCSCGNAGATPNVQDLQTATIGRHAVRRLPLLPQRVLGSQDFQRLFHRGVVRNDARGVRAAMRKGGHNWRSDGQGQRQTWPAYGAMRWAGDVRERPPNERFDRSSDIRDATVDAMPVMPLGDAVGGGVTSDSARCSL